MKLDILKGTTSKRLGIFIQSNAVTTGAGLAGMAFDSVGLTWYYWREDEGDAGATAVTLVTATRGTFASGGFVEKDATNMPGFYEIGIPNAALATGASWVNMILKGAANMAPLTLEIQLVSYNPDDAVRLGLTALPNAAAEAAGGLYTRGSGSGQINQNANGQVDTRTVTMANAVLTAAAIASNAFEAVKFAADYFTAIITAVWITAATRTLTAFGFGVTVTTNNDKTGYTLSVAGNNAAADALLDRADAVETGLTPRGEMRLTAAASAGKLSGAPAGPIVIRNAVADSKDRVTATVDGSGNRTAVVTDVT